jgi:hypothetical protein
MRAAKIENGLVTHIWEVPALDVYGDLYTLVTALETTEVGMNYTNGQFIDNRPQPEVFAPVAPTKEQLMAELAALTAKINALE